MPPGKVLQLCVIRRNATKINQEPTSKESKLGLRPKKSQVYGQFLGLLCNHEGDTHSANYYTYSTVRARYVQNILPSYPSVADKLGVRGQNAFAAI